MDDAVAPADRLTLDGLADAEVYVPVGVMEGDRLTVPEKLPVL